VHGSGALCVMATVLATASPQRMRRARDQGKVAAELSLAATCQDKFAAI
jgi:hypothetical protein